LVVIQLQATNNAYTSWRRSEYLTAALVLLATYFLAGKLGLKLAFVHASATAVWPPSGIALAGFLLLGYRVWPVIFLGAFLLNIATPSSVAVSMGIATGNTLEGLLGACLIYRFADGRNALDHPRTIFKFAALTILVSTAIGATIGVTSLSLGGSAGWADSRAIWLTWWLGDAVGVLIFAPLFVIWSAKRELPWTRARAFEAVLFLVVLFLAGQAVFTGLISSRITNYPLSFLCIPLIAWAAFRIGQRETVMATCALSGMALWGTLHGYGPFVRDTQQESLIFLQAFMGVLSLLGLVLAAVVAEQQQAREGLRKAHDELERRVNERTAELTKTNRELQTSREQLAEAQQVAQVGSWEWDVARNILTWSDELCRIYGLNPGNGPLTYEIFLEYVHPDDRPFVRETIGRAFQDHRPFSFDHRVMLSNDAERIHHARGHVIVDPDGKAVRMVGIGQDITERKLSEALLGNAHAELERRVQERTAELASANDAFLAEIVEHKRTAEALRASQTKFQGIFENSIDAIGVSKNGIQVLINPAYLKMFGYHRVEDVAGRPVLEFIAPDQREFIRDRMERRATGGDAPAHYETRGLRSDGCEFDLEVDVSSYKLKEEIYTLVILRDVTERKRAEEARNRLAAIVESSDDAIVSKALDGSIVSWNAGAEKVFGYSAEEAVGRPITFIIPPDHLDEEPQILERLKRGQQIEHFETIRLRKDGSRINVSLTISPIKDSAGQAIGVSKIARDITERKRAEAQIRQLNTDLEQRVIERTAQLEGINMELESFTYSVSHDLRAPLRAMQGLATALIEDYRESLDDTGRDYAQRIVAAGGRMERLIHDLLAYSRLSRTDLELRPVELEAVVADVRNQLEADLNDRNALLSARTPMPAVVGQRATLVQIVSNLVSNAVKFVAPGDTPDVKLWAEERGAVVRLWVEDNGIGIAPEYQGRIFRIFERLHGVETYPGTGIGLAIVEKGVHRLGGRAGVESAQGRGSRFWVELKKGAL
jgi:PAS domain S-box-containing protein